MKSLPESKDLPFVSVEWLHEHLGGPRVKVVDATWYLPTDSRDGASEFADSHITNAVFFDIDAIADASSSLPHMLPTPNAFAEAVQAMGIGSDDFVVVYDAVGLFSAPRVWWMFRVFGHDRVAILDGGLPAWRAAGLPLASGAVSGIAGQPDHDVRFIPQFKSGLVAGFDEVLEYIASGSRQVVDARSAARFEGRAPEPRAGLASGHMPGAKSLPFDTLIDSEKGRLRDVSSLEEVFAAHGINARSATVASCGSGITACVIALACFVLGHPEVAVYDGSWTEWGGREDAPIATGP